MRNNQTATMTAKLKHQRKWKERHDTIMKDYLLKFRHGEPITPPREIQRKEHSTLTIAQRLQQLKFIIKDFK
jgi:hypothetical protein